MSQNFLFDPETYLGLRKPLLEATTLPPQCYTCEDFYQREIERIFLRNWQFVGRVEQLASAGEFFCYEGLGGSVILVRGRDGEIRAFANSCRHRGSRLLQGSGSCKRIVCPYHSWAYQLDGSLTGTPGMEQTLDFDAAEYPLLPLPVANWGGFIFIHYHSQPEPLAAHLGNMPEKFDAHRCQDMRLVGSFEFNVSSNWKLLAENALEAYHTGSVHRATLGQQDSRAIETAGQWTGLLVEDENSVATLPGADKPFAHIEGLGAEAAAGAYFTLLYPSTQFVFAQDCMWWLAFQPEAVDRTRLTIGACFPQRTIDAPGFEEKVKPYFDRWRQATLEDNAICEMQQQGQRFSRRPGRFAADEFAPHALSNWVIDQVVDD
jgi:phenylpropionate dioxygenase-like ring-hydroxylating dioxygenase large terminal subunit